VSLNRVMGLTPGWRYLRVKTKQKRQNNNAGGEGVSKVNKISTKRYKMVEGVRRGQNGH